MGNIKFEECKYFGYKARTSYNAGVAEITIAFAVDPISGGEILTKNEVTRFNNLFISIDANGLKVSPTLVNNTIRLINEHKSKIISLNIAGNGIATIFKKQPTYTQEMIDEFTFDFLQKVLTSKDLIKYVLSIRSGGQTGFDEAGAKAGIRLGIATTVYAPKGWLFRTVAGNDISNEAQFKERFK